MRFMLHGVPGAGKSQALLWLRSFVEDVGGWKHGVEFVYLASQNTMCALIDGFTLHSFNKLLFMQKDRKMILTKKSAGNVISTHFLIYQRLRWMVIDEASTASLDILAEIDHYTSTHIRKRGTWDEQAKGSQRLFGGLSMGLCGDL